MYEAINSNADSDTVSQNESFQAATITLILFQINI
jgi:hypothetical protein